MNKKLLKPRIKTMATIAIVAPLFMAAPLTQAIETDTKKELTAGGAILTGALIAGPAGAAVGMLAGILASEKIEVDDQLLTAEQDMQKAMTEIAQLEHDITSMEANLNYMQTETERLEENLLTRLEFQMLFRTGDDRLSDFDRERVAMLVEYLNRNPNLKVRLDGHADQRGTDEYNNLLAKYRAQSVADALIARGISSQRIVTQSHGSSLSKSINGDYEGYALERRVNIEVFNPNSSKNLATLN